MKRQKLDSVESADSIGTNFEVFGKSLNFKLIKSQKYEGAEMRCILSYCLLRYENINSRASAPYNCTFLRTWKVSAWSTDGFQDEFLVHRPCLLGDRTQQSFQFDQSCKVWPHYTLIRLFFCTLNY